VPRLIDAYHAMDVFAFASRSETQGIVLAEAMAAGVPVVAMNAAGVHEVVRDGYNGCLLQDKPATLLPEFVSALIRVANLPRERRHTLEQCARDTAQEFSVQHTTAKALSCYDLLRMKKFVKRSDADYQWERLLQLIKTEWAIVKGVTEAAGAALISSEPASGTSE
jgi:1,2-diacylglycerol 3-alpha-glucosyltransferase